MARQPRKESGTGYYHVMLRGINRDFFFKHENDKRVFMELAAEQQDVNLIHLAGWCIMDNHVHMLVKAEKLAMSKAIKVISLKFAARYNRSHQRTGPVFGDRYRSENIEDDTYLLGALRYIHCNPVKARMTGNVAAYQWSSYSDYTNGITYISEEQKSFILGLFGGNVQSFVDFHTRPDDIEYLESREDVMKLRSEQGIKILEDFCEEKGITRAEHLKASSELFAEISRRLVGEARLSLRQAADLLETTHKRVYLALHGNE